MGLSSGLIEDVAQLLYRGNVPFIKPKHGSQSLPPPSHMAKAFHECVGPHCRVTIEWEADIDCCDEALEIVIATFNDCLQQELEDLRRSDLGTPGWFRQIKVEKDLAGMAHVIKTEC